MKSKAMVLLIVVFMLIGLVGSISFAREYSDGIAGAGAQYSGAATNRK